MQAKIFTLVAAFIGTSMAQDSPWCKYFHKASTGFDYGVLQTTVVIPKDGSETEAGYDAPNNCGAGFRANLNGRGAIFEDFTCSYGPDNSACVKMSVITWGPDDIGAAYDAANGGLQLACEESPALEGGYFKCPWE